MPGFKIAIVLLVLAGVGGPGIAVAQWRPDAVQRGVEDARERQRTFQEWTDRERQLQEDRRSREEFLNQQRMNGVFDYMIRDRELRQRERELPCQPGAIACP